MHMIGVDIINGILVGVLFENSPCLNPLLN